MPEIIALFERRGTFEHQFLQSHFSTGSGQNVFAAVLATLADTEPEPGNFTTLVILDDNVKSIRFPNQACQKL